MWFRRKPRNRAFERRHVLDVKVARRQAARMRVRVATLAATLSLGTLFALYLLWRAGGWAVDRFVYENPSFAIHELDIRTDGIIAAEQLRRWAGVRQNQNLFALDLARVKRDLELVAAIESVAVERVLPRTLRIRVTERIPIAQVHSYLLDGDGYVMLPLDPQHRSVPPQPGEHYPVITGPGAAELRPGKRIESAHARAALKFVQAFDHSPMAAVVELARIDLAEPHVLHVETAQQNEIIFRLADFEKQLNRWRLVHEEVRKQARHIETLDLSVLDNVPLKLSETAALPPGAGKIRKTSPYKKKHV